MLLLLACALGVIACLSVSSRDSFGCEPGYADYWTSAGDATAGEMTFEGRPIPPGMVITCLYDSSKTHLSDYVSLSDFDGTVTDTDTHWFFDFAQKAVVPHPNQKDESWGHGMGEDVPVNGQGNYAVTVDFQDDNDPYNSCDTDGCSAPSGATVWIFFPTVSFGTPPRVPPTARTNANIYVSPDPMPSEFPITIGSTTVPGTIGDASADPGCVGNTQGISIIGGTQSWGCADENILLPAPLNVRLTASCAGAFVAASSPFTVCAHMGGQNPDTDNFHYVNSWDAGRGELDVEYRWGSDSGAVGDLNRFALWEYVTYPSIDPGTTNTYTPPDPPYKTDIEDGWHFQNPTYGLGASNVPGSAANGERTDTHETKGRFQTPYVKNSFPATQHIYCHCVRCGGDIAGYPSGGGDDLTGPITITRTVSLGSSNKWSYSCSESDASAVATLTLP